VNNIIFQILWGKRGPSHQRRVEGEKEGFILEKENSTFICIWERAWRNSEKKKKLVESSFRGKIGTERKIGPFRETMGRRGFGRSVPEAMAKRCLLREKTEIVREKFREGGNTGQSARGDARRGDETLIVLVRKNSWGKSLKKGGGKVSRVNYWSMRTYMTRQGEA